MDRRRTTELFERLAEQSVPGEIDLRPRVRARLAAARARHTAGGRPYRRPQGPMRIVGAITLLILALAASLPIVALAGPPPLRIQLQRFGFVLLATPTTPTTEVVPSTIGRSGGEAHPGGTPTPTTVPAPGQPPAEVSAIPTAGVGEGPQPTGTPWATPTTPMSPASTPPAAVSSSSSSRALPRLGMAEAQAVSPFPIRQPAWLPAGFAFSHAFASTGESVKAILVYAPPTTAGSVRLEQGPDAHVGGYAFPATAAWPTQINGRPAVYVRGIWQLSGGATWNAEADVQTLSWEDGGFTYVLQCSQTGLTREEVLRIASSVT